MPPLAIMGGIAAAGSIGGAVLGGHAAGQAADAQANAANHAADLQHQDAQAALAFQQQQYGTNQKNMAPWLQAGQGAVRSLSDLVQHGGFPSWTGQFQAPTAATEQNDPGFQFRLQQGQQALERSAAAKGTLLGGGTGKALTQYGQDYASNEYGNVYQRALGEYQQRYNQFQQNQTNRFNRLGSLAGMGQTAAEQLGQSGQSAANNMGNIYMNSGQQIGNSLQNAGAARASGYVGGANAWSGALGGLSNNALSLYQMFGQGGGGAPPSYGGGGGSWPYLGIGTPGH